MPRREKPWFRTPKRRGWPLATVLTGLALALIGLWQARHGWVVERWGLVPAQFWGALESGRSDWWRPPLVTPASSLVLHANWAHLIGNLVYWWLFASGVERRLGGSLFFPSILLCGILANLFAAWWEPDTQWPIVGLSGAVSACMGAYLGLFPRARIGVILPLGLYFQFLRIPALALIGSWFLFQVLYTAFGDPLGAVAWWTHIAGFVAGLALAVPLRLAVPPGQRRRQR